MARGRRKKKSASNGQPASHTQSSSNGAAASSSTQPVPEDIEVIISAKPPSQEAEAEARKAPKPVSKGLDEAFFERSWSRDDEASGGDWDAYDQVIGTDTTYIGFGSSFQLADRHIDDILALGSSVCENLSEFEFWFEDVSYDARNDAWGVTTEGLVRLARACPGLTRVQLQRTTKIKDAALLAFVEHCPDLVSLEITDGPGQEHSFTERAFDELREHPDWADELDALIISHGGSRRSMKALRRLGRRRQGLTITMVGLCEEKKWGDWELERVETQYRAGREYRPNWGFIYDEDSW